MDKTHDRLTMDGSERSYFFDGSSGDPVYRFNSDGIVDFKQVNIVWHATQALRKICIKILEADVMNAKTNKFNTYI